MKKRKLFLMVSLLFFENSISINKATVRVMLNSTGIVKFL